MKKKRIISSIFAASLLIGVGTASAGTAAIPYAKELPVLSNNIALASGTKDTYSQSSVANSVVGGSYKANMWITDANYNKVSATATNVTDNDTRNFTVDSSAKGKKVLLMGENASTTYVKVEITGKFYPDK